MIRYECDQCGACCKGGLIVEADALDLMREPRLIQSDQCYRDKSVEQVLTVLQSDMHSLIVACSSPCMFLGTGNRCSIYPTRPNACVGMQAGDEQCQDVRTALGLPPLQPVD